MTLIAVECLYCGELVRTFKKWYPKQKAIDIGVSPEPFYLCMKCNGDL